MIIDPDIKYYFCKAPSTRIGVPAFHITPKDFFDKKGFLLDSGAFDPKINGFQRVADSTFEYVGEDIDPEIILLKNGQFMWRNMIEEIAYLYKRRRLLDIDLLNKFD